MTPREISAIVWLDMQRDNNPRICFLAESGKWFAEMRVGKDAPIFGVGETFIKSVIGLMESHHSTYKSRMPKSHNLSEHTNQLKSRK